MKEFACMTGQLRKEKAKLGHTKKWQKNNSAKDCTRGVFLANDIGKKKIKNSKK